MVSQTYADCTRKTLNYFCVVLRSFGDIPRTEVYFADTSDSIGPMGAKSMSESPYNPVAAALGNALADATGIRFTAVPFKPDRIFPALYEKFGEEK